jgi:hypothetical protein
MSAFQFRELLTLQVEPISEDVLETFHGPTRITHTALLATLAAKQVAR